MMWHNSCDAAIVRNMIDRLFARAQLAIEESRSLQQLRRSLHEQNEYQRGELRRAVLESASGRSESKAYREKSNAASF